MREVSELKDKVRALETRVRQLENSIERMQKSFEKLLDDNFDLEKFLSKIEGKSKPPIVKDRYVCEHYLFDKSPFACEHEDAVADRNVRAGGRK